MNKLISKYMALGKRYGCSATMGCACTGICYVPPEERHKIPDFEEATRPSVKQTKEEFWLLGGAGANRLFGTRFGRLHYSFHVQCQPYYWGSYL